jgi:hypothetical protein
MLIPRAFGFRGFLFAVGNLLLVLLSLAVGQLGEAVGHLVAAVVVIAMLPAAAKPKPKSTPHLTA